MNQPNIIRHKSYQFALRIIEIYKDQGADQLSRSLFGQLLRSGTSVGANVEEAIGAESRADFRHKMSIAYKESRETEYWLRLLSDANLIPKNNAQSLKSDATELVKILYTIIKSTKGQS